MNDGNLFCSECGVSVTREAKFCFKCGCPILKPERQNVLPYQLEEKYALEEGTPRTILEYRLHSRVWLMDNGFERLHEFVNKLCDLAYLASCRIPSIESENKCYDVVSDIHFPRYDTDFYPPDGYESIFVEFHDFIPSPFGNQGVRAEATDYDRPMRIFMGRVEPNPSHGKGNVSQTEPPRLRKSKLIEKWGIDVDHRFADRLPTLDFSYSLTSHHVGWQSEHSPNYKGLLSVLGLVPVVGEGKYGIVRGQCVTSLPEVQKALSEVDGSIVYEVVHEEDWLPSRQVWRPFIDVTVKSGWFSTEKRRIFLGK